MNLNKGQFKLTFIFMSNTEINNIEVSEIIVENTSQPSIAALEPLKEHVEIGINSLGGTPIVKAIRDSSLTENILYVNSFESIPNSCGTGKISFMNREFYSNVCEMNDQAHITLSIMETDGSYHNVDFRLVENADTEIKMVLGNAI